MTLVATSVLFLLAIIFAIEANSFILSKTHRRSLASHLTIRRINHRPTSSATESSSTVVCKLSPSSSSGDDFWVRNKARTDIRNFLTQRSIQSFAYLLNQCREEHTVRWLEKALDFTSIEKFHGTGAFNQTKFPYWDSIFLDFMDRPNEVIVVQAGQRRRQRKLSGLNPYVDSLNKKKDVAAVVTPSYLPSATTGTEEKKPTRKLPGQSSYLESLSASLSSKMKEFPTGDSSSSNPETFQRRLLSTRLKLVQQEKSERVRTKSSGKDKAEAFQRRLLAKRLKLQNARNGIFKVDDNDNNKRDAFLPSTGTAKDCDSYSQYLSTLPVTAARISNEKEGKQSDDDSKNPYLDEKTIEYELNVEPSAVVRRILSVREQLSKEWVEDLDMLLKLNDEIMDTFEEYTKEAVDKELLDEDDEDEDEDFESSQSGFVPSPSSSSIDSVAVPDITDKSNRSAIFDRNVLFSWSQSLWSPQRSSSPYRKANFDLLLLLATQESIHRVLKSYKEDDKIRSETFEWLLDVYKEDVGDYFDGHQTYARSEDFLEKILKSPRTLIETKNSDIVAWVDPAQIAGDIVRERSEVALDWMRVTGFILDEHTDLRRLLFANMVSKSLPDERLTDTIFTAVKNSEKEGIASINATTVFGAFE